MKKTNIYNFFLLICKAYVLENYNYHAMIMTLKKGLSRVETIWKLHGRSFYARGLCIDDRSNVLVVTYYIVYLVITGYSMYFSISKIF